MDLPERKPTRLKDYEKIWEYIDAKVLKWEKDCFCVNERMVSFENEQ